MSKELANNVKDLVDLLNGVENMIGFKGPSISEKYQKLYLLLNGEYKFPPYEVFDWIHASLGTFEICTAIVYNSEHETQALGKVLPKLPLRDEEKVALRNVAVLAHKLLEELVKMVAPDAVVLNNVTMN